MSRSSRSSSVASAALALVPAAAACGGAEPPEPPAGPNVLFVVWDTVRADRMSLYGHGRETTPALERFAEGARVFDDCRSTAGITVSSHAAMFTGLLPTENGADNAHQWLDEGHVTLAERLRDAGWRTFAWSANPHVSAEENFTQGFQAEAHPWDEATRDEALAIVRAKARGDRSNELAERLADGDANAWSIKAAGELAQPALLEFLERGDPERPWFAFVNWMEAHRPLVPPRELRRRFLSETEVERSYGVDVSWSALWAYTFGLEDLPEADLELFRAVYDAALLELDGLLADLLAALGERGELGDTVVVLTSDHGEHLGEHHMLDHQFSLHEPLLRVPLVLSGPGIQPGRDPRPVSNHDLFPTLLELAGLPVPPAGVSDARSLLAPADERLRLAEYPEPFTRPFKMVKRRFPAWDPAPWRRSLRALSDGRHTLVVASDGSAGLYAAGEADAERDLAVSRPEELAALRARLESWSGTLVERAGDLVPEADAEHGARLEVLGYGASSDD